MSETPKSIINLLELLREAWVKAKNKNDIEKMRRIKEAAQTLKKRYHIS